MKEQMKRFLENAKKTGTFTNGIVEAMERVEVDLTESLADHELYETLDYDGSLHELIDGHIDHYYYDLRKWSVDNFDYVNQAIDEGLTGENPEFHSMIQSGQYVCYSELMREEVEALVGAFNDELERVEELEEEEA